MASEFRPGYRPRPLLLLVTTTSTTILFLFLVSVISLSRTALSPRKINIPDAYQPGQPVPGDPPCSARRTDYRAGLASCTDGLRPGPHYFVEYDVQRNIIVHASLWTAQETMTLGDLILTWGQPSGIDNSFLMWGQRGAFASDAEALSPDSKVYFISYDLQPGLQEPWRGFINTRPYTFTLTLPDLTKLLPSNP